VEMARLKRTAEGMMEAAAEEITNSLEGLSACRLECGEVGCSKGRLRWKCRFWCFFLVP
jgi:hypothetical protein